MHRNLPPYSLPVLCGAALLAAALLFRSGLPVIHAAPGLQPQPIQMPGFPVPAATVDGWVAAGDQTSIRNHAWALWAGATVITPGSQGWPVWETWYTDTEVAAGPPSSRPNAAVSALRGSGRPVHVFERLRQFNHQRARRALDSPLVRAADRDEQVVGFNKFNLEYAQHIWKNKFQQTGVLWGIQNQWPPNTPVANRKIADFPAPAIGLKPVFEVVRGPNNQGGITLLNYWLGDLSTGPGNSTNPANPTSNTWKQCVVVNTGTGAVPSGLTCPNGGSPSGSVTQKDFYNFSLSAGEATAICQAQGISPCTVKAGDLAVLVAMHFTTRENSNWTWQTFWWNYNQPFPYGPPPASVAAPFNHYAMCDAYSMTVNPPNSPSGKNTLCFNPYLEPSSGIPDGIHSTCMACHGVASFGNNPNNPGYPTSYSPTAYISVTVPQDDTTYYDCQTTTDFSWFTVQLAGNTPPKPTPCTIPQGAHR